MFDTLLKSFPSVFPENTCIGEFSSIFFAKTIFLPSLDSFDVTISPPSSSISLSEDEESISYVYTFDSTLPSVGTSVRYMVPVGENESVVTKSIPFCSFFASLSLSTLENPKYPSPKTPVRYNTPIRAATISTADAMVISFVFMLFKETLSATSGLGSTLVLCMLVGCEFCF